MPYHERPCAAPGLISYRYRGRFGWVMIGATGVDDALRHAERSIEGAAEIGRLEVWDAQRSAYVAVLQPVILKL